MAKRGYVVVSIDYRVYSGALNDLGRLAVGIQSALDDGQAAVRWLRAHALDYRIHGDAIAVAGYSAGAITALNIDFRGDNQGNSGNAGYRQDVQAAVSFAGFTTRVTPNAAPIQMSGGDQDTLVQYPSQVATCNAAIAAGDQCEFHTYPGADHISLGTQYLVSDLIPKAATFLDSTIVPNLANEPRSLLASNTGVVPNHPADGSAATNFDGRLEVLGANGAGTMMNVFQHAVGQGWSTFFPFPNSGGSLTSQPISAFHNADGRLEAGLLGADGQIYTTQQRPGLVGWLPFDPVGQPSVSFASPPSFGLSIDNRLEIFAVSTTGTLMHAFQDRPNGNWSNWFPFDSRSYDTSPESGVAVTSTPVGLVAAAVGADHDLYYTRQLPVGQGWTPTTPLGISGAGRPALGTNDIPSSPGHPSSTALVFGYRGTDGSLHTATTDAQFAVTKATIANSTGVQHDPALVANADGRLEVFTVGADGGLWHAYQSSSAGGGFSSLAPLGGSCAHSPSALDDDGRLEVFCVAAAGDLRHDFQRYPNGPWFGSTSLGGDLVA
jgi:dienelactone hydrolase